MALRTAQAGAGSVAPSRCVPVGVRSRHVPFSAPLHYHHRRAADDDAVPFSRVTATKERAPKGEVERQVENVNRSYCDDFECTSSPAIEQTVKSLARCFERGHLRPEFFQRDCRVNDGFRSYEGAAKVGEPSWLGTKITSRKAEILRLQMLDKGSAQIDWRLRGNFSGAPVVITLKSVAEFNLLTGRVTTYTESWDLSQCSPLTALLMVVSRVAWSLQKRVQDAGGKVADAASSISGTLSSQDEDVYSNPADPTRMFQGGQQNQQQSDYIAGAFLVALVWLAFRAFSELEKLS